MNCYQSISSIAGTARIAQSATIGNHVTIEDYVIIEDNVTIGDHCHLRSHSVIRANSMLKEHVTIDSFSVVGGDPQITGFDTAITSGVMIGAHTTLRESVTVHRANTANQFTHVGEHCLLMTQSHVAHDCIIKNHVTIVNQVLLGGHVEIDPHATIGGAAALHQFTRVGAYAMIAGHATITQDVAPATLVSQRNLLSGLNSVGLRRAGFAPSDRTQLKKVYNLILQTPGNPRTLAQKCIDEQTPLSELSMQFLDFFITPSRRGFIRDYKTVNDKV